MWCAGIASTATTSSSLTDHNYLTSVDGLNALHGADEKFLVMKGEEVTDRFGDKPIHINGLDVRRA